MTLVALVLATVARIGFAASTRAEGDRVFVNEMLVLSLRYGDSEFLTKRASKIALKLRNLDPTVPLSIHSDGDDAKIIYGDQPLLLVSHDEAAAQMQTAETLATTWANNLHTALSLPGILIGKQTLKIPTNGREQIQVLGSEVEASRLENSDPNVVAVSRVQGTLQLRAEAVGESTVTVRGLNCSDTVKILVLPFAAGLPQTIPVEVTGDPATPETVAGAIEGALRTKLSCQSGSALDYTQPSVNSLALEQTDSVTVPVRVTAPEAFPSAGNVTVEVHNTPLAFKSESELWYSNFPESIKRPCPLFAGELHADSPVRLLYHHEDDTDYPLVVEARIINRTNVAARVLIIPGDSPPDNNPVVAGYKAGDQFLRNWIRFSGEIVTVPPGAELPVSVRKINPKQTMSGLCYLRLLAGGPQQLLVRTDAFAAEAVDPVYSLAFESSAPWHVLGPQKTPRQSGDIELSREVYPKPFKEQDVTYRVGGKFGFVRIGQKPIRSLDDQGALDGNFGVVYTVRVQAVNPTAQATDVEVVYESSAGYTGGLFVIDGNLLRTPFLRPKEETQIAKLHLEAGDSRSLTFLTCPLSGGSYPATITVRPLADK